MIGLTRSPSWLNNKLALSGWCTSLKNKQKHYSEFVEQGLLGDTDSLKSEVIAQSILGSDSFVDSVRRKIISEKNSINSKREIGYNEKVIVSLRFETLLSAVSEEYSIGSDFLITPYFRHESR